MSKTMMTDAKETQILQEALLMACTRLVLYTGRCPPIEKCHHTHVCAFCWQKYLLTEAEKGVSKMMFSFERHGEVAILRQGTKEFLLLSPLFNKAILDRADGTWNFSFTVMYASDGHPYLVDEDKRVKDLRFVGEAVTLQDKRVSVWESDVRMGARGQPWILVSNPLSSSPSIMCQEAAHPTRGERSC